MVFEDFALIMEHFVSEISIAEREIILKNHCTPEAKAIEQVKNQQKMMDRITSIN